MDKRGQVTIFIILGIIIIAAVGFIFYTRGFFLGGKIGIGTGQKFVDSQLASIKEYTENCMRDTVIKDLQVLRPNAGFFWLTNNYINYEGASVNYLISEMDGNKVNVMNLKSYLEEKISEHITDELNGRCNLREYENQFAVQKGALNVDTLIADNRIVAIASYPVTISKDGFSGSIKEFRVEVLSDFGRLYDVANDIVNEEIKNGDFDRVEYESQNRDVVIHKDNIYITDTVYTITTDGSETIIFAVRK